MGLSAQLCTGGMRLALCQLPQLGGKAAPGAPAGGCDRKMRYYVFSSIQRIEPHIDTYCIETVITCEISPAKMPFAELRGCTLYVT
jgi:hypothetical protein